MSDDLRDIQPLTGILMGGGFLVGGLVIVFIALDWIRVDPDSIHAPRWVLGLVGGMFALPGVGALYYGIVNGLTPDSARARERSDEDRFSVVGWLLGLVMVGGMTAVASWVAFGPGEREFSGGIGVGGVGVHGSGGSELLGRGVFGIGAVLCGLFTLWGLVYGLRRLRHASSSETSRPADTRSGSRPGS